MVYLESLSVGLPLGNVVEHDNLILRKVLSLCFETVAGRVRKHVCVAANPIDIDIDIAKYCPGST